MKKKIDFKEYEAVDLLDEEEIALFKDLQSDKTHSILTNELKAHYQKSTTEITKKNKPMSFDNSMFHRKKALV